MKLLNNWQNVVPSSPVKDAASPKIPLSGTLKRAKQNASAALIELAEDAFC